MVEDQGKDKVQVKVWAVDRAVREGWAEEDWGQTVNACVHNADNGHPTKEEFPVSNRNVQNVELP